SLSCHGDVRVYGRCAAKFCLFFFFQAEDGIRDRNVTGVQTCALPISPMTARPTLALRPPREPRLAGAPWPPRESRLTLAPRLTGAAGRGARRAMPVTAPARATTICSPYGGRCPIASRTAGAVGRSARGELSGAGSQRTPSPARGSVATTATVRRRRWEREVLSEVISMSSSLGPVPGRHLPCAGETPPPPLARYASTGAIRAGAAH